MSNEFTLYDLEVSVVGDPKTFVCSHRVGVAFNIIGENLTFIQNRQFSLYALAALLPLLPAKQRASHKNDWMTSDALVACPDPYCGAQFEIKRIGTTTFRPPSTRVDD
jgi:uncharacterized repeat protein (TIGR04076 family)